MKHVLVLAGAGLLVGAAVVSAAHRQATLEDAIVGLVAELPADSLCALVYSDESEDQECSAVHLHPLVGQEYYRSALGAKREWQTSGELPRPSAAQMRGRSLIFAPFTLEDLRPGEIGYAVHIAKRDSSTVELFVEIFVASSEQSPLMLTAFAVGTKARSGWILKLRDIFG